MAFRNYALGDEIEVFSSGAGEFKIGYVVTPENVGQVTVEYEGSGRTTMEHHASRDNNCGMQYCRKHLDPHSPSLKLRCEDVPVGNYRNEAEAREGLRMLKLGCNGRESMLLTHMVDMEFVRNNAFVSTKPLSGELMIEYIGPFADILVKIHLLDAHDYDRSDWKQYKECGFLHGLVRSDDKISYKIEKKGKYFLGVTVHRDLSEEMKKSLRELPPEKRKKRQDCIKWRLHRNWLERDEVEAATIAEDADYLISYASADKDVNNDLLRSLGLSAIKGPHGDSPVRFCTDTSLGIGVHYYCEGELLHLGKHGFGMPPVGHWWEEYAQAAKQTKHGLLVLNPSAEYFVSGACKKEFTQIRFPKQDARDINMYIPSRDGAEAHIISRKDWNIFESECQRYEHGVMKAARAGSLRDLAMICGKEPDAVHVMNFMNESSLHVAAGQGHESIVSRLIEFRAHVRCQGWSALHAAAKGGHAEVVEELLDHRAEIECRSATHFTPLHYAANNGHAVVAQLLYNNRADLESKTSPEYRTTPLYLAAVTHSPYRDHGKVIRFLLQARADVHARCYSTGRRNSQSIVDLAGDKHLELGQELVRLLTSA